MSMGTQPNTANEFVNRIIRSARPELLAYVIWMCAGSPQMGMMMTAVIMVMAGLGMILNYLQKKRQIESATKLSMAQQATYRSMLEMSVLKPGAAAGLRLLILADALHVAVERNGASAGRPDA